MFPKFSIFLFGSVGGIVPLFYVFKSGLKINTEEVSAKVDVKKTQYKQMIWECQIQNFEDLDLEYVVLKPSSFKLIRCNKENQYDWRIALPKSIFELNKLDELKNFKLISEERESYVFALLFLSEAQGKVIGFDDWLLVKQTNSHNIFRNAWIPNLFEYEIISHSRTENKAWVLL